MNILQIIKFKESKVSKNKSFQIYIKTIDI